MRGLRGSLSALPYRGLTAIAAGMVVAFSLQAAGWPSSYSSFEVARPDVRVAGDRLDVTVRAIPTARDEVRARFYLSDPAERRPWRTYAYRAPAEERSVRGKHESTFEWHVNTGLVPGTYVFSVWFEYYDRDYDEWRHLDGGSYGIHPLRIGLPDEGEDRSLPEPTLDSPLDEEDDAEAVD